VNESKGEVRNSGPEVEVKPLDHPGENQEFRATASKKRLPLGRGVGEATAEIRGRVMKDQIYRYGRQDATGG